MNHEAWVTSFQGLGDWEERYRYLIELGHHLPQMPESLHAEENKIRGCMSQAWLTLQPEGQGTSLKLHWLGDSDAHIVKGLMAVLFKLYEGLSPAEILVLDVENLLARMGLEAHISMNRRQGFSAMVARTRHLLQKAGLA